MKAVLGALARAGHAGDHRPGIGTRTQGAPVGSEADRLIHARSVVAAVRKARPGRVVFSTSGVSVGGDSFGSAVTLLVEGLAGSGVAHAVIEPRLHFENLLLPFVAGAVRAEGVLRYPLPAGFRVAWASHLDIADAAVALFDRTDVTGVVSVGQDPAITGEDIAAGYRAMSALADRAIPAERSAQKLLGLTSRSAGQWMADIGL
ncbi:hypothetical protein ACSCBZ_19440 [Streptomyces niveiscabiei]|uniref:hypothetical protein n=1 Tax=Streptomyces niveiscabiei TaxID=164115 RepID=UPI0019815D8A|nr:hypothetical protein [Streptomyces niveiscabiei]